MKDDPIYRAMRTDDAGKPVCGSEGNMLGVRPGVDVKTPTAGPGAGGMSVFVGSFAKMPPGILPESCGGLNRETTLFETDPTTLDGSSGLVVGVPHPTRRHAVVEAASLCPVPSFQKLLCATQPAWKVTDGSRRST